MLVRRNDDLADLCRRLSAGTWFVLDTEFVGEKSYYPRLGLVQVANDELAAAIDPLEVDLAPFLELIASPEILKVVHAGRSDFEIFYQKSRRPPAHVFDTQVAAAMVGYGESVSYARLVWQVTGIKLSKLETFTDWLRRPLTNEQIEYALDDVRHLVMVYHEMVRALRRASRTEWVREEFKRLEDPDLYARTEPREAFLHLKRSGHVTPRNLAVLRELAAWREETARRRDIPRNLVMRDEVLVEIGRRAITRAGALHNIRGMHPREADKSGAEIVAAVERGLAVPDRECPRLPKKLDHTPGAGTIVSLLDAYVRARATQVGIAVPLLGTKDELFRLVDHAAGRAEADDCQVLRGWRRKILGEELLALVSGRSGLALDPRSGRVRLTHMQEPVAAGGAPGTHATAAAHGAADPHEIPPIEPRADPEEAHARPHEEPREGGAPEDSDSAPA
ncbi:MAG: ribonuclease D [Planctomycetes bacterium]|nr:ribonuclease D [Planctomycetota bacterium]